MSGIDVSVIMPVRNGEAFIGQAIRSALDQRGVSIEVIVLDDASSDDTRNVANSFDSRVRVIDLERQPTHIRSTNLGIQLARGEFISILHHDDYYEAGKLAAHVALHRGNPKVGLSYSQQLYVGPDGRRLWSLHSPVAHHEYVVDGVTELRHLVVQNYINFANAFVPASVYAEVGAFDEHLWVSAEWDMWVRISRRWSVGYLDDPLVCYRLHSGSLTHAGTTDTTAYREQLAEVVRGLVHDADLPDDIRRRLPLTVANMHFSMAVLHAMRREWREMGRAVLKAARAVAPWRWPEVIRSAAVLPRVGARVQLWRTLRRP